MKLCQRLEMEREKVHYCPSQSAQEQVLLNTLCMEPMSEEMVKNIQEVAPLENVWHRYNVVLKECLCLKQEKARLSQESRHLHAQYRNFLEDNSVSHEALQQSNPLLMVTKLPLLGRPATAPGARRSVAQLQSAGAAADAGDRTHCIVGRHGRTRHASPMSRAL
ncbi:dynein regulatory complex subunit 2-like [Conger conger]|uniref:dynein regulatory complex subunit 2-like n=1 Tax=Conger conger TaxID=82655 RepID=UPI002A5A8B8D|nr:dynein regulatory complex subunit 2-like [Conger conger]